jgi:hypothetical protein
MKLFSIRLSVQLFPLFVFVQALLDSIKNWSFHFQLTAINQTQLTFKVKYAGINSLINDTGHQKLSITTTLFASKNFRIGSTKEIF